MNLDPSQRDDAAEPNCLVMRLSATCVLSVFAEAANDLMPASSAAVDAGINDDVVEIRPSRLLSMGVIKPLFQAKQPGRDLAMNVGPVGEPPIAPKCKQFKDTRGETFRGLRGGAEANFGGSAAAPPLAGLGWARSRLPGGGKLGIGGPCATWARRPPLFCPVAPGEVAAACAISAQTPSVLRKECARDDREIVNR